MTRHVQARPNFTKRVQVIITVRKGDSALSNLMESDQAWVCLTVRDRACPQVTLTDQALQTV